MGVACEGMSDEPGVLLEGEQRDHQSTVLQSAYVWVCSMRMYSCDGGVGPSEGGQA